MCNSVILRVCGKTIMLQMFHSFPDIDGTFDVI